MVDQLAIPLLQVGAAPGELVERPVDPSKDVAGPSFDVLLDYRLGGEISDVRAAGEQTLHLRNPLSHLMHASRISGLLVAFAGFCGEQPLLFDKAIKIRACDDPGVALVFDESM